MDPIDRLPVPLLNSYAWQFDGACRKADPRIFFLESDRGKTRERREHQAKALCATCPVIDQCLRHGLTVQEPYGIWGGLTVNEHWVTVLFCLVQAVRAGRRSRQ